MNENCAGRSFVVPTMLVLDRSQNPPDRRRPAVDTGLLLHESAPPGTDQPFRVGARGDQVLSEQPGEGLGGPAWYRAAGIQPAIAASSIVTPLWLTRRSAIQSNNSTPLNNHRLMPTAGGKSRP